LARRAALQAVSHDSTAWRRGRHVEQRRLLLLADASFDAGDNAQAVRNFVVAWHAFDFAEISGGGGGGGSGSTDSADAVDLFEVVPRRDAILGRLACALRCVGKRTMAAALAQWIGGVALRSRAVAFSRAALLESPSSVDVYALRFVWSVALLESLLGVYMIAGELARAAQLERRIASPQLNQHNAETFALQHRRLLLSSLRRALVRRVFAE
jgi:hypothetical protein